ncbi:hypothetical protein ACFSQQ_20375 [Mesorhizobium kowhaii]|uniref:bestrophin-like domain n=1 Tax=Mesorhizobium kowhaii TaxID=1300272 RepID=UPI0035E6A4E6
MFGATYIVAFILHQGIAALSVGSTARSFKAVSPGMLPPLGIIFGLFVAFTAAQVWSDSDHANAAVNREASALRSVVVLASSFPGEPEARLRTLVRSYIEETTSQEWPLMAESAATLTISPALNEALRTTLALAPGNPGQEIAQREITRWLEDAFEARRQRILVSSAQVNPTKWACLILQAFCALLAIAVVHSDNRMASAIALGSFATGVAASVLLILAHDRPFTGEIAVSPQPLLQVMPEARAGGGE